MDGDGELSLDEDLKTAINSTYNPAPSHGPRPTAHSPQEGAIGGRRGSGLGEGGSNKEEDEMGGDLDDDIEEEHDDEEQMVDDDDDGDSADENSNNDEASDDNDDEGDTTDGGPPSSTITVQEHVNVVKRPHVQSKRMQEYQAMQQMTHTAGRVFICPEHRCRRVFNSAPGLRYHMQTHQDSLESFTCDSCHKEFKSLNGLKYHRKRKRCQGCVKGVKSTANRSEDGQTSVSLPSDGSRVLPPPLVLSPRDECPAPRLLDLAHIATGPQSPLLQGLGPSRSASSSFFDSPEKNAVMALSSMAQKRSSRKSNSGDHEEHNVKCGEEESEMKSKRPMNGFMLFAQKNRAEFNKMFPNTNNRMISTKLSEEWAKLPEEQRQKWKEDARLMAEVQRSKHPDCWKRKKYTKDRN